MRRVAAKPVGPSAKAVSSPSIAKTKPRKKRKATCQPKSTAQEAHRIPCLRSAVKSTRKGKQSLRRTSRRKAGKKTTKMETPKQASETALPSVIDEQMNVDSNMNIMEATQPCPESTHDCAEDLASSQIQGTVEDSGNNVP